MNNNFIPYLRIQSKRILILLPRIAALTLSFFVLTAGTAWLFLSFRGEKESNVQFEIGILGDPSDPVIEMGLEAITSSYDLGGLKALVGLDDIKYTLRFTQFETEKDARKALQEGRLSSYIIIPAGFIEAAEYGRNDIKIICVTNDEFKNSLGTYLIKELLKTASSFLTASQCAVFSLQDVMIESGRTVDYAENTDRFCLRLFMDIINRGDFVYLDELGISDGLDIFEFCYCSVLLIVISIMGLVFFSFFQFNDREHIGYLKYGRVSAVSQVLVEFLVYFAAVLAGVVVLWLLSLLLPIEVDRGAVLFPLMVVTAGLCAFQVMLYELTGSHIAGMMVQFLCAVVMDFAAGAIYPSSLFPEALSRIGSFLPNGSGLLLLHSAFGNTDGTLYWFMMIIFSCIFLAVTVVIRNKRIESVYL